MLHYNLFKKKHKLVRLLYIVSLFLLTSIIINTSFISAIHFQSTDYPSANNKYSTKIASPNKIVNPDYNDNLTLVIYDVFMDIMPNGEDVGVSAHLTYQNNEITSIQNIIYDIEIQTPFVDSRVSSISINDAIGHLYYVWEISGYENILNVTLREPLEQNHFTTITVTYLIENAIFSSVDVIENFILQWTFSMFVHVEQFTLVATLPTSFILANESEIPSLVPEADYESIDNRRFEWNFYDVLADSELAWIIRFQFYKEEATPVTLPIGKIIGGVIGAFVVGILIGGLIVFLIFKVRTDIERKEIVESLLSDPEKEILRIIKDEKGVTTQSKICSDSEFSKAKVSYYLAELEKKGIIARERWGRMNRVRIIADSYEKVYFDEVEKNNTKTNNI
ncbi:MAG: helix-turn-helix transcriptional regulator [Candidatus Heimdallarchaeota archaeon]